MIPDLLLACAIAIILGIAGVVLGNLLGLTGGALLAASILRGCRGTRLARSWVARMRAPQQVDIDKLVRRIVIDCALLRWFAARGGNSAAARSAIAAMRADSNQSVLDFLERFIEEGAP